MSDANIDAAAYDRSSKRAKTDSDETTGDLGLFSLSKDILTEISHHLDTRAINAMFSITISVRKLIDWHTTTTQNFWRDLVLKKFSGFELQEPDDADGHPLPWRDIFIATERNNKAATTRLQQYIDLNPELSQAEKLEHTRYMVINSYNTNKRYS